MGKDEMTAAAHACRHKYHRGECVRCRTPDPVWDDDAILAFLGAHGGASPDTQVPAPAAFEDACNRGVIQIDCDTECYLHPDAQKVFDDETGESIEGEYVMRKWEPWM